LAEAYIGRLVNPLHPAAGQIKVEKPQPFRFDARMFR
jgi:hypothetical protein